MMKLLLLLLFSTTCFSQHNILTKHNIVFNDSLASAENAGKFKAAVIEASQTNHTLFLQDDTVWVSAMTFTKLKNVRIHGPGVLAYRDINKKLKLNIMMLFTQCQNVQINNVTFLGNMRQGYSNAVLPIYFQGGGDLEENEELSIRFCRFDDCWWIGLGGKADHSNGVIYQVADTVARDIEVVGCKWMRISKLGTNLGSRAITTLGLVDRGRIEDCEYRAKVDGVVYGDGFCLLPGIMNFSISGNKSYDAYSSDFYFMGFNITCEDNLSVNVGKNNYKNIELTGIIATAPGWPGVHSAYFRRNIARGSGRNFLGAPSGYNVDGPDNILEFNVYEAQNNWDYPVKQGQIAMKINGPNNIVRFNTLRGMNLKYPNSGEIAILVSDRSLDGRYNIIACNIIEGWNYGIITQYSTQCPHITGNTFADIAKVAVDDYAQNNGHYVAARNTFVNCYRSFSFAGYGQLDNLLRKDNIYINSSIDAKSLSKAVKNVINVENVSQ